MSSLEDAFGVILHAIRVTSLDDAFASPLETGGSGLGAARARVEAELMQRTDCERRTSPTAMDRYDICLAERAVMQVPRKARAKAFAEEAIGASRIIDAFRGVDSEIDPCRRGVSL